MQVKVPDLEDPLYAPFWEGARQGKIVIQCCRSCGTRRWPPRFMCWSCQSLATEWVEARQEGRLYSWTVVGAPTTKAYVHVPYIVGIVEIVQSPPVRLLGYVTNVDPGTLVDGLALRARFVRAGPAGEMTLVQWEPVA